MNILILCLLLIPAIHSIPSEDTTNNLVRSWVPWWPKNDDIILKAMPEPKKEAKLAPAPKNETLKAKKTAANETIIDPSSLTLHEIPSSPLDGGSSLRSPITENSGKMFINFEEMSDCSRDCSSDLQEALSIVLQDMSHVERYQKICRKYKDALSCVKEGDGRCEEEDQGMFEMVTSGLNYMCVEQGLAFNATIKCIDDEAGVIQSECEDQCQTKNVFMNWIMRGAMQNTIQQGVSDIVGAATGTGTNANPLAFLDGNSPGGWADMLQNGLAAGGGQGKNPQEGMENFRQFTNDLCRIGDCMLDCLRSKFNIKCEGSAGTLLSEVFVRPIAASQNKLSVLRPILGMFMPEQCKYLHSNSDLKKHRIDATMDSELKRMYTEKVEKELRERAAQDELLSSLVPLDKNGVPMPRSLPEFNGVDDSPLDVSVKTLDQLIMEMYSKNESKVSNVSEKLNVTNTIETELTRSDEGKAAGNGTEATTTTTTVLEDSEASGAVVEASGDVEPVEETSGASGAQSEGVEASGTSGDVVTTTEVNTDASGASGDGIPAEIESEDDVEDVEASGAVKSAYEASGDIMETSEGSGSGDEASGDNSGEKSSIFDDPESLEDSDV